MADEIPVTPPSAGSTNTPPPKPPDNLLYKDSELDDSKYVTEELARMNRWVHILLAIWFILLGITSVTALIKYWPPEPTISGLKTTVDSLSQKMNSISTVIKTLPADSALKVSGQIAAEQAKATGKDTKDANSIYFIIVILSGILGGTVHGLASLMDFRGSRRLFRSWSMWYFCQPIVGGMLSLIFYFVLKAGLFPNASNLDVASPYGIAAFGALCGLFTEDASNKLSDIVAVIFSSTIDKGGKLGPKSQTPNSGGTDTTVH
jgi:hypothetical protein